MRRLRPATLVLRRCLVSKEVLWVLWLGPDAGMSFLAETWVVVVVSGMCFSLDVGNPEAPPLGIVVVVLALAAAQTSTMMIIKIIESLKRDAEEEKAMDSSTTGMIVRAGSVRGCGSGTRLCFLVL